MAEDLNDKKMPLLEHLVELRQRLLYSILAFFACFIIAYYFHTEIFNFLVAPLQHVFDGQSGRRMIFTAPTEAFFTYIKVAFFTGVCLAFPVIAGQLWMFVAPGLYKHERNAFLPFIVATPVMFTFGAALLYYVVLPVALQFFASFEVPAGEGALPIQMEAKMSEYLSLVMTLILAFGISFELPVLLLLLVRVGIVSATALAEKRRYAIVGVVAFAGLVTPPDVMSQLSLAIPMYLLYESSIWIGYLIEKRRSADDAEEDTATTDDAAPAPAATAPAAPAPASPAAPPPETDFNQAR